MTCRQGQEDHLGALGLFVNAIAPWNTAYILDILDTVSRSGAPADPADLARLAPLVHERTHLVGHNRVNLPPTVAAARSPSRARARPSDRRAEHFVPLLPGFRPPLIRLCMPSEYALRQTQCFFPAQPYFATRATK